MLHTITFLCIRILLKIIRNSLKEPINGMYIFSITHEHSNQRGSVSKKATFKCEFIAPIVFVFPLVRCPNPSSIPTGSRLPSSMTPSESTAVLLAKSPAVQTAKRAEGINNSVWSRPMAFCRTRLGLYFVFCILSWGSGFWLPAEQYVQRPCE